MEILLSCYKMAKLIFATCAPARADSEVASAPKPLALISRSDKLSRSFILAINIQVEKNCSAVKPPVSPLPLAGSLGPCLVSLGSLEPHNHTFMEPPLRLWRSQMIVVA